MFISFHFLRSLFVFDFNKKITFYFLLEAGEKKLNSFDQFEREMDKASTFMGDACMKNFVATLHKKNDLHRRPSVMT